MDLFLSDHQRECGLLPGRVSASRRALRRRVARVLLPAMILLQLPAVGSFAAESLADGIPQESILFLHWQNAADGGFASTYLRQFKQVMEGSGFLEAYFRELSQTFTPAARKTYKTHIERWQGLLGRLPWWKILSTEVAAGSRIGLGGQLEFVLLFRSDSEDCAADLQILRDLLYAFSAATGTYELEVGIRNGATTTVLHNRLEPLDQVAVSAQGNVVGIATSATLLRRSFQLLSGETLSPGYIAAADYAKLSGKLKEAGKKKPLAGDPVGETARFEFVFQPRGVLQDAVILDVIEEYHYVASFHAAGIESRSRTVLSPGKENPLLKAIAGQPPVGGLAAAIPAEAVAFSATSGTDPSGIYDFCLELLVTLTDSGDSAENFEREQARLGVRLQRDILRNLTGRRATAVFAPGEGGVGAGIPRVALFEVHDGERAAKAIDGVVTALQKPLAKWNLELLRQEDEGSGGKRYSLKSGLLGFEFSFGVHGDFLVLATVRDGLDKVVQTLGGKSRNLADAGRLNWLPGPAAPIDSFYSGVGAGIPDPGDWVLKVGGLVGTLMPDSDEPSILKPLLMSLPRLKDALRTLDILTESSGYCLRNGLEFYSTGSSKLRPVAGF